MRRFLIVVLAAAVAAVAVPALAATNKFRATLNGKSETPKTTSKATGSAVVTIQKSGKIKYTIKATKLTGQPQAIHIHFGAKGKAGPVIIGICLKPCSLPKSGTLTKKNFAKAAGVPNYSTALKDIRAGKTYVNIHTKKNPGGEIRGQLHK